MSTETNAESATQTSVEETKGDVATKSYTEEAYLKVLSEKDTLKQKLRQLEASSKEAPNFKASLDEALTEKSKLFEALKEEREKFEKLQASLKETKLQAALSTALDAAGALNKGTVSKLLDRNSIQFDENGEIVNESVVTVVKAIQESDPYLFGKIDDPKSSLTGTTPPGSGSFGQDAKRAGENNVTQTLYLTKLAACKTTAEVNALAKEFNIFK
jgi:vacuolar-type H+-ATPase subunit I/STV1